MFTEVTWQARPTSLRVLAGLRGDVLRLRRHGEDAGQRGRAGVSDSRASPKLGLAYAATDDIELYANWGKGFHSNDARGVVNETDPVPGLVGRRRLTRSARGSRSGALTITGAYFWLDLDSELIFVGDSNAVEPKGGSERDGYELTLFWQPVDWIGIDAVYTGNQARYVDNPDGDYVEGAVEHAGQIGLSAIRDKWEASVRLRYLGEYALTPDNAQRADASTTINLRGAYRAGRATWYAELLNVFDEDGTDIVYWYEAYVDGFRSAGFDFGGHRLRAPRTADEPRGGAADAARSA